MMTPLSNPQTPAEKKYQKSQIKTRNCVERHFNVLKRRFPALSLGFRVKLSTILTAIVAAAVLHNLAIDLKDSIDEFESIQGEHETDDLEVLNVDTQRRRIINSHVREALILNFFSSET